MSERSDFGKYVLLGELGRGGMADVFLAVTKSAVGFNKLVVVKRLKDELAESPEFVTMLLDEARLAARLNHPNVVLTNEVGSVDESYFIEMEYLDGQPLHRVLGLIRKDPARDLPGAMLGVIADSLAGLHHAHELRDYDGNSLGVVHRDATPQNLFLTYEGITKVMDFGVAKAAGKLHETSEGVVKGKVSYMAPEHALSRPMDRRADLFSIGVLLWEVVTGQRFWKGKDEVEIFRSLMQNDYVRSPRVVVATLDVELDRIVQKSLAHLPEDRYATALAFREDLVAYLDGADLVLRGEEVGKWLAGLFADKRKVIEDTVKSRLGQLRASRGLEIGPFGPLMPDSVQEPTPTFDGEPHTPTKATAISSTDTALTPMIRSEQAAALGRKKSRAPLLAGLAVVGVLGAGALLYGLRPAPPADHGLTSLPGPVTGVASALPPAAAPVRVAFRADPPSARFRLDGEGPLSNPYEGTRNADGKSHVVVAEWNGKREERTVTFAHDVELTFDLQPAAAGTTPKGAPPAWHHPKAPPVAPTVPSKPGNAGGEKKPPRPIDTSGVFD